MRTVEFLPETTFKPTAQEVDAPLRDEFMKRGGAGVIIGQARPVPLIGLKKTTLFIAKDSGSDIHVFPGPILEIGKMAANHQYRMSKYAKDKVCLVTWSEHPCVPEKEDKDGEAGKSREEEELAQLRGHALPVSPVRDAALRAFLGASGASEGGILSEVSPWLATNNYCYSSIEPVFYQPRRAKKDLPIIRTDAGFLTGEEDVPLVRAPDHGVLFTTSHVFQRKAKPSEVAADNRSARRVFVDVMYIPVRSMEFRMGI